VSAKQVLDLIASLGSFELGEVFENQLRFPLVVRLPEDVRASAAAIGAIQLRTMSGQRIPLSRLADIQVAEGPATITREWGYRRITISSNVRGRDMGSFVAEAQRRIEEEVKLPPGRYHLEWGGSLRI
jgi:cobalt-zinc-cadmium resistance protein CzcA